MTTKLLSVWAVLAWMPATVALAQVQVSETPAAGSFPLVADSRCTPVFV